MTSRVFRDIPSIYEVECSGNALESNIDLLGITLFHVEGNHKIASVNMRVNECSSSDTFSSCYIDQMESRKSRLATLVVDLKADETRMFGCNITGFRAGLGHFVTWLHAVRHLSMYDCGLEIYFAVVFSLYFQCMQPLPIYLCMHV